MSWKDLFKPQDKDPKNIVEWLGLITDDIKKLKNTDNWYDEVNLLTDKSIIDNLNTNVSEFALSARQGYLLNQKIGISDQNISVLEENVSQLQLDMEEVNNKLTEIKDTDIKLINESISNINNTLTQHGQTLEAQGNDIEQNKTDIEGLTTRVSDNENNIELLDGRVSENENDITSLNERATNNENNISDINNNINIIEEDITDIRNTIKENIKISNMRIDSLVGTNVKISGLEVSINSSNTQLTVNPGKAIIQGKIIQVKESIIKEIDPLLLTQDNLLYTLISLEEETENVVVSLSETDMDSSSLRIHSMIINNGSIIESSNNSNMIPISSIVGISADNEAANIREQIPSGFTVLGDLDYDYMKNNENQVKFKTKSVAYVHGYKIEIPAGTIVNIDKAPEKDSRDDLLFLESWKDIDFPKTGQLKWRIRYVNNVDFNRLVLDGFNKVDGSMEGDNYNGLTLGIVAQGGNSTPINPNTLLNSELRLTWGFKSSTKYITEKYRKFNDNGLYYAGFLDNINFSKQQLKTLDGYCYAIPMFRLYRRPSCGKIESYEYDNINKLCDYDKVKSLVTSEKVERVTGETIYGKTLLNHCTPMGELFTTGVANVDITRNSDEMTVRTTTSGSTVIMTKELTLIKPLTEYTIIIDNVSTRIDIYIGDRLTNNGSFVNNYIPSIKLTPNIINKIKFTTGKDVSQYFIWIGRTDSVTTGSSYSIKGLMILEGDWTESKYLPDYFEGFSSLGESEYNLIKVKNGIIQYPTYNPISGNQKLNTFTTNTCVISENTIIPEFAAEIKRGGNKISDLSGFGKIETVGDENIEFINIKGRTLENLIKSETVPIILDAISTSSVIDRGDYYDITFGIGQTYPQTRSKLSFHHNLKPNTVYTLIYKRYKETDTILIYDDISQSTLGKSSSDILVFTTKDNPNDLAFYVSIDTNKVDQVYYTQRFKKYLILEGDYSNVPIEKLPYVDGIKSVGENENNKVIATSCDARNEFIDNNWYPVLSGSGPAITTKPDKLLNYASNKYATIYAELEPGEYILNSGDYLYLNRESMNGTLRQLISVTLPYKFTVNYKQLVGFSIERSANATDPTDIYIGDNLPKDFKIKIEKGSSPSEFIKDYKQEIYLKEPLRSLPNGVYDEIVGNKVIRRVGKLVLDGSSDEMYDVAGEGNTTEGYSMFMNVSSKGVKMSSLICDKLLVLPYPVPIGGSATNFITFGNSNVIVLNTMKSNLSTPNVTGFKTWLSQNPVTVYYELLNPIEEYLENVYDKESIKTYQLDAPLRSLPNGVKDEIKDGILIRRCGEIILDGSSDEKWGYYDQNTDTTLHFQSGNLIFSKFKSKDNIYVDNFKVNTVGAWDKYDIEGITVGKKDQRGFDIRVNRTRLSDESVTGLQTWLNDNPIKVIYELGTPQIIKLNETHINKPEYSINRQFKDGNWLRILPNGVKDTIENGKVIRRVGKLVLHGREQGWTESSDSIPEKYYECVLINNDVKKPSYFLVDKLSGRINDYTTEGLVCTTSSYNLRYRVLKTRLSEVSLSGFKNWLSQNPTTLIYELSKPIEEALDNTNYTYYPYHKDFNTTCASLYVTDGYNNIDILNNIKSNDNIIETSYRVIEDNSEVEDTHFKPSINGKELSYKIPKGKNKINMFEYTLNEDSNKVIVYRNDNKIIVSTIEQSKISFPLRWFIRLKPNTNYTISCDVESVSINNYRFHVYNYSEDTQITTSNYTQNSLTGISSTKVTSGFKTTDNGAILVSFLIATDTNTGVYAPNIPFTISNLQIEEGTVKTGYEEFIPDVRPFENVESNDVGDLRNLVSLTGYNYEQMLNKSFDMLLNGEI